MLANAALNSEAIDGQSADEGVAHLFVLLPMQLQRIFTEHTMPAVL